VTATYSLGDGASLTAYYPSGGSQSGGQDVDTLLTYSQSESPDITGYNPHLSRYAWSDDNSFTATIGVNSGLAIGVLPGTTSITVSYAPPGQSVLIGTATLTVQAQLQSVGDQDPGGNNPANQYNNPVNPTIEPFGYAMLTFNAVNQANIKTISGRQIGGTLHRGPNIALWTDIVTATLSAPAPPAPQIRPPGNESLVSGPTITGWMITDATLSGIPAQNPNYAFGNPVEPLSYMASLVLTTKSSGPDMATAVSSGFEENWSEDGIGYTTPGPYGVKDVLNGQMMAKTPKCYQMSATYTVIYNYIYTVHIPGIGRGDPGYDQTINGSGSTHPQTVTQNIWVCGTGAVPMTSLDKNYMVADTLNPQIHP
jgi:hypothetical protein